MFLKFSVNILSRLCIVLIYVYIFFFFFFNDTATTEIYTLSLHDALPISPRHSSPSRAAAWRSGTLPSAPASCVATRWRWTRRRVGSGGDRALPSRRV